MIHLLSVHFVAGGLFQHVVEDSWRPGGFRLLDRILFGACKHVLETDAGYLCITCSAKWVCAFSSCFFLFLFFSFEFILTFLAFSSSLRDLSLQPSLTKDSFFSSLQLSQVQFPSFESLALGYTDPFPPPSMSSLFASTYMHVHVLAYFSCAPPNHVAEFSPCVSDNSCRIVDWELGSFFRFAVVLPLDLSVSYFNISMIDISLLNSYIRWPSASFGECWSLTVVLNTHCREVFCCGTGSCRLDWGYWESIQC